MQINGKTPTLGIADDAGFPILKEGKRATGNTPKQPQTVNAS